MDEIDDGQEYAGVGRDLRLAREAASQIIDDVAKVLHIGVYHLEAIEAGRSADWPSAVYLQGFVRSYAGHLNLDADEMVRRIQLELPPVIKSEDIRFPISSVDSPRPTRKILLLAIVLAISVFSFWLLTQKKEAPPAPHINGQGSELAPTTPSQTTAEAVIAPPAAAVSGDISSAPENSFAEATSEAPEIPSVEELVGQDAPATPSQTGQIETPGQDRLSQKNPGAILAEDVGAVEINPGATLTADSLTKTPADTTILAPSPPLRTESEPEPAAPGPPEALVNAPLVLRASADTWMQVSRADGSVMKSWVMRTNEHYVPPMDEAGLTLMIGNAGALTVFIDGVALPPLGAKGAVIRALPLETDKLKAKYGGGNH